MIPLGRVNNAGRVLVGNSRMDEFITQSSPHRKHDEREYLGRIPSLDCASRQVYQSRNPGTELPTLKASRLAIGKDQVLNMEMLATTRRFSQSARVMPWR